jgi:hypothetical protein
VNEEKHRRLGRILLQRVDAVAVVRGVLDRVVRADLENVDEHADVLEDRRALGGQVRVHERVLATAVPEVEDEVAQEANVVLLDVDCRAEARGERGGVVRAVRCMYSTRHVSEANGTYKMRDRIEVLPLPDAPIRRT